MKKKCDQSRRNFCFTIGKGVLLLQAVSAGVIGADLIKSKRANEVFVVDLTDPVNSALKSTGGGIYINGKKIVVTKTDSNSYAAFNSICQHKNTHTITLPNSNILACPNDYCTQSTFDLYGKKLKGDSPDLDRYDVKQKGDILEITVGSVSLVPDNKNVYSLTGVTLTNKAIEISLPKNSSAVRLFSSQGRVVHSSTVSDKANYSISTGTLSKGHYLLEVYTNERRYVKKIVF